MKIDDFFEIEVGQEIAANDHKALIQGSVFEVSNFFGRIGYTIDGLFFTPDDIEHGILRSNRPHPVPPGRPLLFTFC